MNRLDLAMQAIVRRTISSARQGERRYRAGKSQDCEPGRAELHAALAAKFCHEDECIRRGEFTCAGCGERYCEQHAGAIIATDHCKRCGAREAQAA